MATGGLHICVLSTSFQKNDMGWPQQPLQEEYQISVKNWIFDDPLHKETGIGHLGARDDQIISISRFFDEMRQLSSLRPLRLLRPLRSLRLQRT